MSDYWMQVRRFVQFPIAILLGGFLLGAAPNDKGKDSLPLPKGESGPQADALANRLMQATHQSAWENTKAVRWSFAGRRHHLWDRQRQLIRVRWDGNEVLRYLYPAAGQSPGRAFRDGQEVQGEAYLQLMDKAYALWVNDAFWLNPFEKLFDPGVSRSVVDSNQPPQLLMTFTSGGLTPGDSYLWEGISEGLPTAWRMWVSIIPEGGVRATWENWQKLSTGAMVSTRHREGERIFELGDVVGTATLEELESPDPFRLLGAL
ncbi:MAG: hypothetical protein R3C68_04850 [Myxococcota bacterium]